LFKKGPTGICIESLALPPFSLMISQRSPEFLPAEILDESKAVEG